MAVGLFLAVVAAERLAVPWNRKEKLA
jgi:hypothetical protein